jgi:hypothetical protein
MNSESSITSSAGPGVFAIISLVICLKLYVALIPVGFQNLLHLPVPYWRIEQDENQYHASSNNHLQVAREFTPLRDCISGRTAVRPYKPGD